jgi:HNH/ENDO VII superfamily nuclease
VAGETAASLAADAEALSSLEAALASRGELVGTLRGGAADDVTAMSEHWGGPRATDVLSAAEAYVDALAPVSGAFESAAETVRSWSTAALDASESMAIQERSLASASALLASGLETPTEHSDALDDASRARSQIEAIREAWQTTCTNYAATLSGAISTLFTASTTVIAADDATVLYDNAYYARMAELVVLSGLSVADVDPSGQLAAAIAARAGLLGGEDGKLMFLIIETAHEGDLGEADGNFSMDDMIAASDPATVEALLRQAAEENGHEWDDAELDFLVSEIVGTAWMMRASEDEVWEDIDDDVEWYEQGVVNWARENLLAPVASITVGALCYSAAVGGSTVTGGASLAGAAYCGGLAAATYNATNTWAHGGDGGDVLDSFTDPQTWMIGATEGLVFQGATNLLLRAPAPSTAGRAPVVQAFDDIPMAPARPSGNQYSVAYEVQLDPTDFGRRRIVHDNRANAAFDAALNADEAWAASMDDLIDGVHQSVSSVGGRSTPDGWTWHHVPSSAADGRLGVMHLVPSEQHAPGSIFQRALHPDGSGGYAEWAVPAGAPANAR